MNPVERVMSTINLVLQGASLSRPSMPEKLEDCLKNASSLGEVRNRADKNPDLKNALKESLDVPKLKLIEAIRRLK